MNLFASSERLVCAGPCSAADPLGFAVVMTFLSWDSAPLHRSHRSLSLSHHLQADDFDMPPPSVMWVRRWFLTTSTVCSMLQLPGLLHPGHGHGVRHVSWKGPSTSSSRRCQIRSGRSPIPRSAGSYPPKNSPHKQPYCITAAVALLLLPHQVLPASPRDRSLAATRPTAEAVCRYGSEPGHQQAGDTMVDARRPKPTLIRHLGQPTRGSTVAKLGSRRPNRAHAEACTRYERDRSLPTARRTACVLPAAV